MVTGVVRRDRGGRDGEGRAGRAGRDGDARRHRRRGVVAGQRDHRPAGGAALVSVTVPVDEVPPVTLDWARLTALRVGGAGTPVRTRTPTQSRKKSRDVELRRCLSTARGSSRCARFDALHVRPHVSLDPPSVNAPGSSQVPVARVAVQVAPPSHESCTHIRGAPDVRQPAPPTALDAGERFPGREWWGRSRRTMSVLLATRARMCSSRCRCCCPPRSACPAPYAFAGFVSNPLPSPRCPPRCPQGSGTRRGLRRRRRDREVGVRVVRRARR